MGNLTEDEVTRTCDLHVDISRQRPFDRYRSSSMSYSTSNSIINDKPFSLLVIQMHHALPIRSVTIKLKSSSSHKLVLNLFFYLRAENWSNCIFGICLSYRFIATLIEITWVWTLRILIRSNDWPQGDMNMQLAFLFAPICPQKLLHRFAPVRNFLTSLTCIFLTKQCMRGQTINNIIL